MEKITANAVYRALQNQKRELQKYLDDIGFPSDVEVARIIRHSAKGVVDAFVERSKTTIDRYYAETGKKWPKPLIGLDWNLPTRPEKIYLEALESLHLSQKKWSITATTEERVKKLVTSGIKKGHSPREISKNIENLDPQVFSKNRADLIAINQIGKAKQYGEWIANKEYSDAGYLVLKYWSTVNDNRVTRSHTANQNQGWIHIDKYFTGTGDKIAPASDNPRCRCAIQYEIGNKIGEKQPKDIQQKIIVQETTEKIWNYLEKITAIYNPKNDFRINWRLENWEWSREEQFYELFWKKDGLTKEEMIAFYWYKYTNYKDINSEIRKLSINPEMAGLILNLNSFLNAQKIYKGKVWRGIPPWAIKEINKIKALEVWDVYTDFGFMSSSSEQFVWERFAENENWIIMSIKHKTWKDVRKYDLQGEYEILFNPWVNLEFIKNEWNIYFFKEI